MTRGRKIVIWVLAIATLAGALAAVLVAIHKAQPITIKGAVLSQDPDPQKQLPIADVEITGTDGSTVRTAESDSSGFFSLTLRRGLRRRQPLTLHFRHPGYQPLDLNEYVSDQIYLARMVPISHETRTQTDRPEITVANIRVRYSVKATTEADVGSAVKTFQVVNVGDIPCKGRHP